MSDAVKALTLPTGERIVSEEDDAKAKADALRLGLLPKIEASLRRYEGRSRCAAAIVHDGNRMVAIIAWRGFASAIDNGWVSVSASPPTLIAAVYLERLARRFIEDAEIQSLERSAA